MVFNHQSSVPTYLKAETHSRAVKQRNSGTISSVIVKVKAEFNRTIL